MKLVAYASVAELFNKQRLRDMGMFDEFQFYDGFDMLPDDLPKDGWQTKDLDCSLSTFRVLADGRVLRQGSRLTNDENTFYFSDRLSGDIGIYNGESDLTLIINNGFVIEIILGNRNGPELDLNWQPFEP